MGVREWQLSTCRGGTEAHAKGSMQTFFTLTMMITLMLQKPCVRTVPFA
jgi:hypothetical protein